MGMSSCKCTNIFEPMKIKNIKEHNSLSPNCHENYLTKEGKISPNQSSKYLDKSSINKYEDNNFYTEYKKGIIIQNPRHKLRNLNERQKSKPSLQEKEDVPSQRSIDGQNTPKIQLHEIKKIENNAEIPVMFESYIINRFNNRETFKELFKESYVIVGRKMQDVAP